MSENTVNRSLFFTHSRSRIRIASYRKHSAIVSVRHRSFTVWLETGSSGWYDGPCRGWTKCGAASSLKAAGCDDGAANGLLPVMGAEDFSYFMMPEHGGKPGCFFFLGGFEKEVGGFATYDLEFNPGAKRMCLPCGKDETSHQKKAEKAEPVFRTNCMCHATGYDFNDNLLPIAMKFWVRLVESRLGCSLYDAEELL